MARATCYYRRMSATRRAFLATLATSALHAELEKGKSFPSEWKLYSDPATEFDLRSMRNAWFDPVRSLEKSRNPLWRASARL